MYLIIITSIISGILMTISLLQIVDAEVLKYELVLYTATAEFGDINNNDGHPDPGETGVIVGKLFLSNTEIQVGTYRCWFTGGGWVNSSNGSPVTLAIRVLDFGGNDSITVVGDEITTNSTGKPVIGTIVGGTGSFNGIYGKVTSYAKEMIGTNVPVDLEINYSKK